MKGIGIFEVVEEILRLNRELECDEYMLVGDFGGQTVILTNMDMCALRYPDGYEFNTKNGVTNKHHSKTGIYESFPVCSLEDLI